MMWQRILGISIVCVGLLWFTGMTQAQDNSLKSNSKLTPRLEMLTTLNRSTLSRAEQARQLHVAATGAGSLFLDEQGQVMVYIRVQSTTETTLDAITDAGASITHVAAEYRTVTAYINPADLPTLATLPTVENVREALQPAISSKRVEPSTSPITPQQTDCGSAITSEGYTQLNVDGAASRFGLDGSGITVGVLSDSYDRANDTVTDAAQDIASGDLPGTGNPCGRTTPISIIAEYPSNSGAIDEGRAMLQIVHDLAPAANLSFATAFEGLPEFADRIRDLRNAGADVIVDDVFYFSEPFYQDGPVSVAIEDVTNAGGLYFTLAGNHNEQVGNTPIASYEAPAYRPTACPTLFNLFTGAPFNIGIDCHSFNPSGGDPYLSITLSGSGQLQINFQWAEPWYGVSSDIDIFLVDGQNRLLAFNADDNVTAGGTQQPFEYFTFTNPSLSTQTFYLVIARFSGSNTPPLKYILLQSTLGVQGVEYSTSNSIDTFGPTVYGHSGEDTAISVGAVEYSDSTRPQNFTSLGYKTVYFEAIRSTVPAAPLSSPQTRLKPDIGATNGGANTFFGQLSNGAYRFYGTSAAAPHAAAVGALVQQQARIGGDNLSQAEMEQRLEATAATMVNGVQAANGAGLVDTVAAVEGQVLRVNLSTTPAMVATETSQIDYTLSLQNDSNRTANGVSAHLTLPSQVTFVSASDGGRLSGDTVNWSDISLAAAGGTAQRTLQVSVTQPLAEQTVLSSQINVTSPEQALTISQPYLRIVDGLPTYLPLVQE